MRRSSAARLATCTRGSVRRRGAVLSARPSLWDCSKDMERSVRTDDGVVRSPQEEKKIVDFFKNDYIEVRPLTRPIAEKSRELQRASAAKSLRCPKADSVHLATALLGGVKELHTF